MKMKKNYQAYKEDWNLWITILALFIIGTISLYFFSSLGILEILRIVYGSIFVLFLPGYVITFLFFTKDEIDILEKIALSFGLSIAIVPLATFYLNFLFSVKINVINVSITILGIILLSIFLKTKEKWFKKQSKRFDNFIDKKIIRKSKILSKIFKE